MKVDGEELEDIDYLKDLIPPMLRKDMAVSDVSNISDSNSVQHGCCEMEGGGFAKGEG